MKNLIIKLWKSYVARRNAALRLEDYWRYKDGEQIDTNASHYKDLI
jgi:hypothetical protein